jgi:hypothetical protein
MRNGKCGHRLHGAIILMAGITTTVGLVGCMEFSHFGQVSDREGAFAVNDVKIEQQEAGGRWRTIGETDGKGKWNILKMQIKGGGRIRMSKPGYQTLILNESEFLQQDNIVMSPTGDSRFGDEYLKGQDLDKN